MDLLDVLERRVRSPFLLGADVVTKAGESRGVDGGGPSNPRDIMWVARETDVTWNRTTNKALWDLPCSQAVASRLA